MHIKYKGDEHRCFSNPRLTTRNRGDLRATACVTRNDNRNLLRVDRCWRTVSGTDNPIQYSLINGLLSETAFTFMTCENINQIAHSTSHLKSNYNSNVFARLVIRGFLSTLL